MLVAACALLSAVAIAAPAGAATAIHFQPESVQAYEVQLHKGEVHALTFHPGTPTGHLHISMNNGTHYTVAYASGEQPKLVAQAEAAHARVQIAAAVAVKKTAPVKHKLRYIAGGILIVVIVIVLIVLLIGRRRAIAEEAPRASGENAAP
jgi:hypothetical protein